ncbi:MAG: ATP-binding cassette domain-containing protein [Alphaproteobacteria bacterium]|nr:ATP-binding cassette domain-containing protein [Alphaproteobacteria bacterium]
MQSQPRPHVGLATFLGRLWRLTRPYWSSEDRWPARALFAVVIGLTLGGVYLEVLFNSWNNAFYNALQEKNEPDFWRQFGVFGWLAALFIFNFVATRWFSLWLQIRWRDWLTRRYIDAWLGGRVYYRFQVTGADTDNPDQRIAEDVRMFVSTTLGLITQLISSVLTLGAFLTILWGLSGDFSIALFGRDIAIPGYMVWFALVYSVAGTWLTHLVGKPLVPLNYAQQRYEADFRFALVRLRENAEQVALYGGEGRERANFAGRFAGVVSNWYALMWAGLKLNLFTSLFNQLAIVFPFIVAAPRYFSGAMPLGGLMQTASAFGQVQGALSFFVQAYASLADWKSVVDRLLDFETAVAEAEAAAGVSALQETPSADGTLAIENVDVGLPGGATLIAGASAHVSPGDRVLLTGDSGSGKSTLFRVLAGIWPFGRGHVALPPRGTVLFLPQKPYMPIGTLREALLYPNANGAGDETLDATLVDVRLPQLVGRLDEVAHWGQRLSPGEQQRLAVARALLAKPAFLFLDEATSALDEATEEHVYRLMSDRLPKTAIVSIGHRPSLKAFHKSFWHVERKGGEGTPARLAVV